MDPVTRNFLALVSILGVCLLIPPPLSGESIRPNKELGVVEIKIKGNSRTQKIYINNLIQDCLEDGKVHSWKESNPATLEQCILNSKIFAEAHVRIKEPVIDVELKERWTLVPIPYVFSSGDDNTLGIFLMENNLFGLGKKGGLGGSLSSNGNSYFLYYYDPLLMFSDWSYSLRIGNKILEPVLEHDDHEYYSYEMEEFSYGLNIGKKILLSDLWLSLGISGKESRYNKVNLYQQPEDYDSFSGKIKVLYKDTDFKFFFNEGLEVDFEYEMQVNRSDDKAKTKNWNLTIDWQKQFVANNAIQLQLQLQEIGDATLGDALLHGGSKGFRGIEHQGLWVNSAWSISLDYQVPVKSYGYGIWTIAPFFDIASFDPVIDMATESVISCGMGGYLYLKNIAFPGVGLVFGHNNEFGGVFVSFSLGMMM